MEVKLTEQSRAILKEWVEWENSGGFMMLGEIRTDTLKQDRGNYTQLKQAGYIETFDDGNGLVFVEITDAGRDLIAKY